MFIPNDPDVKIANVMAQVVPGASPFYIAMGENDLPGFTRDAGIFAERLNSVGVKALVDILPGHDHFDSNARCVEPDHLWMRRAIAFLRTGSPELRGPAK